MVVQSLKILGSSVGTEAEIQELLNLAEKGDIVPATHFLPLETFQEAIEAVKTSAVSGKMVLKLGS
jgi:propanol-preferring alcohol dehydrogenase